MANEVRGWQNDFRQAAIYARLGMEALANNELRQAIDSLLPELARLPPATLSACTPLLTELLDAQQRRDYSWFADLIEYRLLPLLGPLDAV
ncbi:MAG: hypothetical protein BWK76_00905 [Desulfobulbaceae bacterium A2]|nr:MAG: hypothetical protein BWK76_00905 [Desulfobulbaceae bacterium A2]